MVWDVDSAGHVRVPVAQVMNISQQPYEDNGVTVRWLFTVADLITCFKGETNGSHDAI